MKLFKRNRQNEPEPAARRPYRVDADSPGRTSSAFSYYANRSDDAANIGRGTAPKPESGLKRFMSRVVVLAVVLIIFAVLANTMILQPKPNIVALTTSSNKIFLSNPADYQRAADKLFDRLENRNKLTVDTNQIANSMLSEFPELGSVTVTLPTIGHIPTVYIQPNNPSLILEQQSGGSFVIDDEGKALVATGENGQLSDSHVPAVQSQTDAVYKVGDTVLPSSTVTFIKTVSQQLSARGILVTKMVIPKAASELDIYLGGQPFYGKFNLEDNSPLQQAGTFIAVFHHLSNTGKLPKRYIDVRIDGRAYYE